MHKKSTIQKIAAILLIVVLIAALFPATLFAQAETPQVKPFYLVNWDRNIPTNSFTNVYYMPYTWINTAKFDGNSTEINIGVYVNGTSSSNLKTAAKLVYDDFSQRPAGSRYINLAAMGSVFKHCVKDVIDFEDAIRLVSDWVDRFLTEYKALGGEIDGFAIDLEYNSYTSFYLQSNNCTGKNQKNEETGKWETVTAPSNLDVMQDIVRNERVYQAIIRPQLKELEAQGLFNFYTGGSCYLYDEATNTYSTITTTIDPETGLPDNLGASVGKRDKTRSPIPVSEITTINRYDDDGGNATSRSAWSNVMSRHIVNCIDRAVYEPMIEHFPNAVLSDYSHADTYSWNKSFSDGGTSGTGAKAGNASNGVYYGSSFSEYFYASYSGSATRQLYDLKPAGQNAAVFEPVDPYSHFIMDINRQKNIVTSTLENDPDAHVNVWVPYFHYASDTKSYGNTPYFSELMYHLGLTNPEPFFGYIIESEVKSDAHGKTDPIMSNFQYVLGVSNELLAELTRVAGASDRKPIITPIEWDNGFMVSGMYAGGRNIWRLTPDTTKVSVEDFKVDGKKAPTFTVNGVTITFPQGRIIEDADITRIGSCGYWIETPANVNPVITRSANHFQQNPSFGVDFENYLVGTFTGSSTSIDTSTRPAGYRPDTYLTKDGAGTAAIVESNGNKALTLTGTTTITNQGVPAQITAGDYYAQQQVWEVTVTMPSKFSGTTKLLGYTTGNDGFQINSSGKVYYPYVYTSGSSSTFTSMSLTLTAGKTYTFKRVIDFTAKTCSYYVYDANGSLLKSVTNKKILNVTTPVSKVYITTSSVNTSYVYTIDDYKLYPSGVTAKMDLYEEITLSKFADYTGIVRKVSDTTAARTTKTAYRVSYANASTGYQKAVLKNSNTGAVIEEVLMAPGDSGYFTGIVEASASNPVTFALTTTSATAPSTPNYENGDFDWPTYAENMGAVCYVGTQSYATLEEALAAATNGQTIVMIGDAELSSTAVVSSSVKIQQNGYSITVADEFTGDYAIALAAGGNLTWTDGLSIDAGAKTAFGVIGGNLTVSGGTITAQNGILVASGNLTVSGGTVTATDSAIVLSQDAEKSAATVTVTGGTISGTNAFLHKNENDTPSENLTVTISGATLNGTVKTTEEHFEMQVAEGVYTLHGHTVVVHEYVAPTCTETGLTQGIEYTCCGKFNPAQEIIPANGHTWVDAVYCGATKSCSVCHLTDGDPKAHEYSAPVVTPNTCTTDGYTSETCTNCGHVKKYDIVPAAHKPGNAVAENIVPANCTEAGTKDEVIYCTVCTEEISRVKVTTDAATGHTNGSVQVENQVDPTCTTDGSYDNATYCTVCTAETSRETIVVPATGHTDGDIVVENEVAVTCTDDGSYDNVTYCTICMSETSRETVIIPAPVGGHDSNGFTKEIISAGTCTTDDSYDNVVYCTACGYEHSRQNYFTPAPGHKYKLSSTHVTCENCDYSREIGTSAVTIVTGTNAAPVTWAPKLAMGMEPLYAKTTAEGLITTEGDSANDYNLKVEWPVDGTPTLTLKNATLTNDNIYPDKKDTISIGGTANFIVKVEGTNVINGNPSNTDTTIAAYRGATGILATNKGTLTIQGGNRADDTLLINNNAGTGIDKGYNALTIDKVAVTITITGTSGNAQHGIILQTHGSDYADLTNLTVTNAKLDITAGKNHSNMAILMNNGASSSVTSTANVNANTGDILFKDSEIRLYRSNSTGSTQVTSSLIAAGVNSTFTINNCDTYIYSRHIIARYTPILENVQNVYYTPNGGSKTDWAYEAGTYIGTTNIRDFHTTHVCTAGEPVIETISKGSCCEKMETVTYCTICNARTVIAETDVSSKSHTPGNAEQISKTNAKTGNVDGQYVLQYTCSICGETWQEEKAFGAATLYYLESGARSNARISTSTAITMKVVMNPGDATIYFTTGQYDETDTYANNWYVRKEADFTEADAWNMKLEYPEYGTPVLTLRDATIINNMGLWYGLGKNKTTAPVTIVLEGENYIENPAWSYHQSLGLHTTGGTTITGDGSLHIKSAIGDKRAILTSLSSVTLLNTNIHLQKNPSSDGATAMGLELTSGTLTVDNSTLLITGYYNATNNYRTFAQGVKAPDMVVKNGSNVTFTGSLNGWKEEYYGVYVTNKLTIIESTLTISHGGYSYGNAIKAGEYDLQFANGYNINFSTKKFSYSKDEETGVETYTLPDPTQTFDNIEDLIPLITTNTTANNYDYFVQFQPVTAVQKFEGTRVAVQSDLALEFAIKSANIPENSFAVVTRTQNGQLLETNQITLTDAYKNGAYYIIPYEHISAKEIQDEVTIVIKAADGTTLSETKTDSVYDYALRLLRDRKYAADNEYNNALKSVLVDMLNYGTMAQIQFEHNNENPSNIILTPTEWGYATSNESDDTKAAEANGNGYLGTTFELKSNIGMAIALDATVLPNVTTAVVTFTDYDGIDHTYTIDHKDATSNSRFTIFVFSELAAANGRQDIVWKFYNGETELLTVTDSLAAYVSRNRTKYPYMDELMKYCDSAKTYFTLLNAQQ